MKTLYLFTVLTLLLAGSGSALGQIPNVKVENAKGETINTSFLSKHDVPLIISFWSTFCKPCLTELNAINDLVDEWKEQADFKVVAVSIDDSRSLTRAKVLSTAWEDFIVIFDRNQEFKRAMNVNVVPQVFVVNSAGEIVYSHTGYTPGGEDQLLKVVLENQ